MIKKISSEETLQRFKHTLFAEWPDQIFEFYLHEDETHGNTVKVAWLDGPETTEVWKITGLFSAARTAIELGGGKWGMTHWLAPDGSVSIAHDSAYGKEFEKHHPGAKLVTWGLDFIYTYHV